MSLDDAKREAYEFFNKNSNLSMEPHSVFRKYIDYAIELGAGAQRSMMPIDAKIAELEQFIREREAEIDASFPFVGGFRSALRQIGEIADSDSCSPKMRQISELVDTALAGTIELECREALEEWDG